MKLLFVEDEKFTREGIRKSINWQEIGVSELEEAVDGLEAIAKTEHFKPDIVLTDIKMPRMDGVELAFQIRRKYPDAKIIFMSGYADKEYLKAAISLKAISYVEKPIDIEELEEALQTAISLCTEERIHREKDAQAQEYLSASSSFMQQEAALQLIRGGFDEEVLIKRLRVAGFTAPFDRDAVTIIAKVIAAQYNKEAIDAILNRGLSSFGFPSLGALKNENHYILHLFSTNERTLDLMAVQTLCYHLAKILNGHNCRFSISAGKIVGSARNLQESYTLSVVQLQEMFYQKPCTVFIYGEPRGITPSAQSYQADSELMTRLYESLVEENFEEVERLLTQLTADIRKWPSTLTASVKEIYYRILLDLDKHAKERGIEYPEADYLPGELMERCDFLDDAYDVVKRKMSYLKQALIAKGAGSLVPRIIRYIHQHYAQDHLSVQEISENMQMTASHIIAVFRETTGATVKQYLMGYRIEKAKELLKNNRLKVLDVATQVGFKDGEHFAKSFRKYTGMTPSEFRERYTS